MNTDLRKKLHEKLDKILNQSASITKAIIVACLGHANDVDKSGQRYILHPLHVMFQMNEEDHQICAVCHDLVEDTDITLEDLKELGFTLHQVAVIDALTKTKGQDYQEYISGVKKLPIARMIKLADIEHNMDMSRIKNAEDLQQKDLERIQKYIKARSVLGV